MEQVIHADWLTREGGQHDTHDYCKGASETRGEATLSN